MLTAFDQVLQNHYATTLANQFPRFTWHNYFMNSGTYDLQVTNVYTDTTTLPPAFTGPQWQLFRSHLKDARENWQAGNAGVEVDQVGQTEPYPIDGPKLGKPSVIQPLGVAYVEFFPTTLPANRAADLTITFSVRAPAGSATPKVSVLPIANFAATPHPGNNFVQPTIQWQGTYALYTYVQTIQNFHTLNRVAVILSNVDTTNNQILFPIMQKSHFVRRSDVLTRR